MALPVVRPCRLDESGVCGQLLRYLRYRGAGLNIRRAGGRVREGGCRARQGLLVLLPHRACFDPAGEER
jgi:hypothetical protein